MGIIRSLRANEENKRLLSNYAHLTLIQVANYVLPLATLPYLVRIIGPDYLGVIAFSTATVTYLSLLTDYGFNLSATRQISISRNDENEIKKIYSSVITVKALLASICFLVLLFLVSYVDKFKLYSVVFILNFGVVVGNVMMPTWLFQGLENMKYISYMNLLAKSIFMLSVFIFVQNKDDYYLVPLIYSIGSITSGVAASIITKYIFHITYALPDKRHMLNQLKEGWHVFISSIAISFYTVSVTFILGIISTPVIVGYYSAGERIVKAVQGLYAPVSQSIYPYINNLLNKSKIHALLVLRKLTYIVGSIMLILSVLLYIFSGEIVSIVLGSQYIGSVVVVKTLSFIPFLVCLSNIFGIQTMLNFNRKIAFSRIIIIASMIGLVLAIVLSSLYSQQGASVALLMTELIVTVAMFVYIHATGLKIIGISSNSK